MRPRLVVLLLVAVPLAAADLAVKAALPTDPLVYHERSGLWELGSLALLTAALSLARLPSRLLAAAAGVFAAGVAGNLASTLGGRAVPNPFVAGEVAFNLADVFVLAGIALCGAAAMRLAVRHRNLLPTHTIPVRIVRRLRARRRTIRTD